MCDLVTGRGDLNWKILQQWLPQGILDKINNIQPPNGDLEEDKFIMDGVVHEVGLVKHFYRLMVHLDHANATHDWKIIWWLKVPEVINTFVWLLKHGRLLTNQSKSQRGLGLAACKLCGHATETTSHVFRECPCALEVWVNKVPTEMQHEFFNL